MGKRRSIVENEYDMLRALADEIGVSPLETKRHHLPIARPDTDWIPRPKTRGDCLNGPRPCPFATCPHHLATETNELTGNLTIRFPDLEIHEMPETCSLDAADRGGLTLEEVATMFGLVRERVRQIEERGLRLMKQQTGYELGLPPETRDRDQMAAAGG